MKLQLLGTAGYHPTRTRHTAGLFLPEVGVALDAGTGFFRVRDLLATDSLDIFLTHAHLDHVFGLTYLLDTVWGKTVRVRTHGLPEKLTAVREQLLSEHLFPVALPTEWAPLTSSVELRDGGKLTSFPLPHAGGSLAFRLDWPGHSLAYVTDTTATADAPYLDFIRGVDLLVHECNFTDDLAEWAVKTGHSHTTPVAELAAKANVGRLVLTHVNPLADDTDPVNLAAARRLFPRTELGRDEQVWEF